MAHPTPGHGLIRKTPAKPPPQPQQQAQPAPQPRPAPRPTPRPPAGPRPPRPAQGPQKAKRTSKPDFKRGRLPDKAVFCVMYDAAKQTWTGSLVIDAQEFKAQAGNLFGLLSKLDKMYRKSLLPG